MSRFLCKPRGRRTGAPGRFGTRTDKIPSGTGKCRARPARRTAGQFEISNKKPAPQVSISKTRQDKFRLNHSITPTNKQVTYWKFSGKILNRTSRTEISCGSSKISRHFLHRCRDKRGSGRIGGSNASSRHTPGAAQPGDAAISGAAATLAVATRHRDTRRERRARAMPFSPCMTSSDNGIAGEFSVMQRGYYDIFSRWAL